MADPEATPGAASSEGAATTSFSELANSQAAEMQGQQAPAPVDTGQAGTTPTPDGEMFYDSTNLPPELAETHKQMQAAFTKKTQALAAQREKIQAYDQFMANPQQSIQQMAQQYGLTIGQAQQVAAHAEQQQAGLDPDWQPNSWNEVIDQATQRAKSEAYNEIMSQMQPMMGELRGLKKTAIEQQLDSAVPEWRQYEDEFADTIRSHPTLVNDPLQLARLAIPSNVQESRMMQAALAKLKGQQEASAVGGGSTSPAPPPSSGKPPTGAKSFQEAVQQAAEHLRQQGKLHMPRS